MKTLVERLDEEADYTHKAWYRVADDETREQCRALTLEAAARIRALEAALDAAKRQPYLGIATNDELRAELRTRMVMGNTDDDYRTWDGPRSDMETKPEFDPAWVCGVCGKRHGQGECLGVETKGDASGL